MNIARAITLTFLIASSIFGWAQSEESNQVVRRKSEIHSPAPETLQRVRVGNDTVPIVLYERNYGRFDRGLFNYLYIPKGKWAFGFTASYGELGTEDMQLLGMLTNVDFKGKLYSLKPSMSYFFNNNHSCGLSFNYTRGVADLANLGLDIDDDMNFTLSDVSYINHNFKVGAVYRAYVGLSASKRFAVFNEVALEFSSGRSNFKRTYDGVLYSTRTVSTGGSLNFSPGLCVFIQDYVAFNVSFGVFGLKLVHDSQTTNGINDGSRLSSGANFKFNIFNINFGLMVVI